MDLEGSLPRFQMPAARPYPELDQPSPCTHPTSWRYILILSYLRLGVPSGLFPIGFPIKTLYSVVHYDVNFSSTVREGCIE